MIEVKRPTRIAQNLSAIVGDFDGGVESTVLFKMIAQQLPRCRKWFVSGLSECRPCAENAGDRHADYRGVAKDARYDAQWKQAGFH